MQTNFPETNKNIAHKSLPPETETITLLEAKDLKPVFLNYLCLKELKIFFRFQNQINGPLQFCCPVASEGVEPRNSG